MRRLTCTLGGLLLLFGATTAEAGRLFVIDTGVNLSGVVDGPDFTGGDGRDCHGHGTAMAVGSAVWNNPDYTRDTIVNASTDSGVTWVVPAGNSGDWAFFWLPGRIEKAIVVAGADGLYRWSASNFGPQVDLYADACAIGWCGTSVSAAIVAGLAFDIAQVLWYMPPAHIRNVIVEYYSYPTMIGPGPGTTNIRYGGV